MARTTSLVRPQLECGDGGFDSRGGDPSGESRGSSRMMDCSGSMKDNLGISFIEVFGMTVTSKCLEDFIGMVCGGDGSAWSSKSISFCWK